VQPIQRFNVPELSDIPLYFKIQTESQDVEGKLAAWKNAYDMGTKLAAADMYEMIGARVPEPDEEVLDISQQSNGLEGLLGGGGGGGGQPQEQHAGMAQDVHVNDPKTRDGGTSSEISDIKPTSTDIDKVAQRRYSRKKTIRGVRMDGLGVEKHRPH